jgi:hypothetical protein
MGEGMSVVVTMADMGTEQAGRDSKRHVPELPDLVSSDEVHKTERNGLNAIPFFFRPAVGTASQIRATPAYTF